MVVVVVVNLINLFVRTANFFVVVAVEGNWLLLFLCVFVVVTKETIFCKQNLCKKLNKLEFPKRKK